MTQMLLSAGDQSLADAVNLMDLVGPTSCYLREGESLLMPEPAIRRYHSRTKGNASQTDTDRTITLKLRIQSATSGDSVWSKVRTIRRKLRQARRAYGSGAFLMGNGVVLAIREWDATPFTYYDVLTGMVSITKRDFGASYVLECDLVLTCLPCGRGAAQTLTVSGTLTNGVNGSYFLPVTIPGDEDALAQIIITDTSPTGVINRLRLARRSLDYMVAGDYTPVVEAAAVSPGTRLTGDATASGGDYCRVTCSSAWKSVGNFTGTSSGLNHGDIDVLVRVRDSTVVLGGPSGLAGVGSSAGGSMIGKTTYQICVTALDGSGNESGASNSIYITLAPAETEVLLTWAVTGTPSNHRVYANSSGIWYYVATGSSAGSYTLAAMPATPGTPPAATSAALLPAEIQAGAALNVTGAQFIWGDPVTARVGGSNWELLYVGTFPLPPIPLQEGGTLPGWQVLVQAAAQSGSAPTLDIDIAYFLPHDEPQCIAEYTGMNLATKRTWIIDTRRDERVSCLLTDGTNPQGQATPEGPYFLGPGGNLVIICAEMASGIHDITATYTVQVRYAPRVMDPLSNAA